MKPVSVVGVDPGLGGALVYLSKQDHNAVLPMPLAGRDIDLGRIAAWLSERHVDLVCIEQVHAMPKQGVTSTFSFGKGYGGILGVCAALKLPVLLASPQAWKKVVLAGTSRDKQAAVAHVARRWPSVQLMVGQARKPHDGIADATCLAEFAILNS